MPGAAVNRRFRTGKLSDVAETRHSTSLPSVTGRCAMKPRSAGHLHVTSGSHFSDSPFWISYSLTTREEADIGNRPQCGNHDRQFRPKICRLRLAGDRRLSGSKRAFSRFLRLNAGDSLH